MIEPTHDLVPAATTERLAYNLTQRESQVLGLLVKGCSSQQIADGLGLRFYTVTTHLKHIETSAKLF